ncbi:MAG: alanine racemase [Hydrogenophilales bacterium 28-61-23]|nr:MAG: alanine racemase [Hydrogenophilales bacterium 28-61-23]
MTRPLIARVDSAALAHNLGVARAAAPHSKILAVVKADAYGHGLTRTARALRGADAFAVLRVEEAAQLRGEGYSHPIVLLEGFFHPDELPEIARLRLRPVIHRADQADILARTKLNQRVDVWLKLNTGMNRLGIDPKRLPETLTTLRAAPHVGSITLMTHFASADEENDSVERQLARFQEATRNLGLPASLANSAALLRHPQSHADWVRPGIMLYGASPFASSTLADQTGEDIGLLPAMTLESKLIGIQFVHRGEGVGYGARYIAERDMKIGVVACGYADGYPRHADTGTPILVDNQLTRTLGRVSMDMLNVDLTPIPTAHVGSPVTLWGSGAVGGSADLRNRRAPCGCSGLPVEHVAAAAGTLSYELLTALAPRVRVEET